VSINERIRHRDPTGNGTADAVLDVLERVHPMANPYLARAAWGGLPNEDRDDVEHPVVRGHDLVQQPFSGILRSLARPHLGVVNV
jgi:hypothetical protein